MVCPPLSTSPLHDGVAMKRAIDLEISVHPYRSVNGVVVEWNSVVRRRVRGEKRWDVAVLPPVQTAEIAHRNAVNWVQVHTR